MPSEHRHFTEEERSVINAPVSISPTTENLLLTLALYGVVNRSSWMLISEDFPELEIPSVEALMQKAVNLGRYCRFWRVFDLEDLGDLATPIDFRAYDSDRMERAIRLGQSTTGMAGNNVKLEYDFVGDDPGRVHFSVYPNTGDWRGDYDASILLELRFAEGFSRIASSFSAGESWEWLRTNCDGSRLLGHEGILEDGWK